MVTTLERKLKQEYELRNDIISFDKSQRFLDSRLVKMLVRELIISRLKRRDMFYEDFTPK